jgi:hypothetical protein
MQIVIVSTDRITNINGVPVRAWEGITERGVHCWVFVHRLAVASDEDSSEFDRELKETLPPPMSVSLRQVL